MANDVQAVAARVAEVAEVAAIADGEDGVVFVPDAVSTRTIRDGALYHGVRVAVDAQIGTARVKLRLDVNFGDPVTPAPHVVELPALRPLPPSRSSIRSWTAVCRIAIGIRRIVDGSVSNPSEASLGPPRWATDDPGRLKSVNREDRGRSTDNELALQEEEDLLAKILRHQVGVDPDHLGQVLDLAPVGIVNSAWRNSPVEGWHASAGPLTDGAMLRTNVHTTWRVREIVRRWRSERGMAPEWPTATLDDLDVDETDLRWVRLPARPNGKVPGYALPCLSSLGVPHPVPATRVAW